MSVALAAGLAAASAAVLVALPSPGRLRLTRVTDGRVLSSRRLPFAQGGGALLLVGAVAAAAILVGAVPAGLAVIGWLLGRRWQRRRHRRRAVEAERAGAVQACGVLAAELSAGRMPADALAAAAQVAAGPVRDALRAAAAAAALGGDVPAALATAAPASAVSPALRALAACWTVCATSGAGLAASVRRLEEGLRADQAQRRAVDAELAGPRATAVLLAALPAAGLLMAAGLGADPVHVLLHTTVGLVCLVLGLSLDALGLLWTGRLVARAGGSR